MTQISTQNNYANNIPADPSVKHLHELGFELHWLRKKSKIPLKSAWQKRPSLHFRDLIAEYVPGMNLGVRLGSASKLTKPVAGYLAVIDCDVKSSEDSHRAEMEARLKSLFPMLPETSPRVLSGRGNGSCHVYCRTLEPAKPERLAQSRDQVAVTMAGSPKPSAADLVRFSPKELSDGWRLRPAWEICVLGQGQQVVLPPSIHPDTYQPYRWLHPVSLEHPIPLLDLDAKAVVELEGDTGFRGLHVRPINVNLNDEPGVPAAIRDLIATGEGSTADRSADLWRVCHVLITDCQWPDEKIIAVLTDRHYWLGEIGFDHANTTSREKAARWVRKTVDKIRHDLDPARSFEQLLDEDLVTLFETKTAPAPLATAVVDLAVIENDAWKSKLQRKSEKQGGAPKDSQHNVSLILRHALPTIFKHDHFSDVIIYGSAPPWRKNALGQEVDNLDLSLIRQWFVDHWRLEAKVNDIDHSINAIGYENSFHPVKDYLTGLKWDGVTRTETWLKDYLGASAPEPYLTEISVILLVAMVRRIYQPGCKFDYVLIFEGKQGLGKSTAFSVLVGDQWFSDQSVNIADKDAVLSMRGIWLHELSELASMRRSDKDAMKAFITRTTDKIRPPYGRRMQSYQRQTVFIGTTNEGEYLQDTTGNRRFWPVRVGATDLDGLAKVRDQLFAEAVSWESMGQPIYLKDKAIEAMANAEQSSRVLHDVIIDRLSDWLDSQRRLPPGAKRVDVNAGFAMSQLWDGGGPLAGERNDRASQMRVGIALRSLGLVKKVKRLDGILRQTWLSEFSEDGQINF